MKQDTVIEFLVPIKESVQEEKNFFIKGVAINETTTRNGVRYTAEELEPSAHTLRNKPILKDHHNSVDSIVGRTTEKVFYDQNNRAIMFEGMIKDPKMREMISEGLVQSVSIGATVKQLEEVKNDDGKVEALVAKGIDFVELSLVAIPADPNAGFTKAIMEAWEKDKDNNVIAETPHVTVVESTNQEETLMAEEKKVLEELQAQKEQLQREIAEMELKKLEEQKERLLKEQQTAPIKNETVGVVANETTAQEAHNPYVIETKDVVGVGISADYNEFADLKKLRR